MQREQIEQQLKQINLNLDHETIDAVQTYLIKDIGFLNDIQLEYQIYAALAVVSQIQTLPTIGQTGQSKNGIRIESVMSHLGKLSKERFLDTINRQLEKYKKSPQNLKKKVEDIRYSYRFYKKYQTTFQQLYKTLSIFSSSKDQFSAMFWVIFLYIKNTYIETENITESKTFLILLFRMIFQKFLSKADFADIFTLMQQNIGAIPEISAEKYEAYSELVQDKINQFYSQRFSQLKANFNKLINNYTFVERMVDDMSNAYVKDQTQLRYYNDIDELSYLELKKNLTPQVFRKAALFVVEQPQVISMKLCFDDDDADDFNFMGEQIPEIINQTPSKMPIIEGSDGQPTPKSTNLPFFGTSIETPVGTPIPTPKWNFSSPTKILSSPFNKNSFIGSTPISKKIQNQAWLNNRINTLTHEQIKQFLEMYSSFQKISGSIVPESQQAPQSTLKTYIYKLITEFSPKCQNYEQRFYKILAFITANFSQVEAENKLLFDEMNPLENKRQNIIGIAALSCEIFNYINNSVSYGFKHHCDVFKIDVNTAFEVLNMFSSDVSHNMPTDLSEYLKNTTKRFFVDDIWENGQGYKILCQNSTQSQFCRIRKQIILCSQNRVKQICRHAKIETKIVNKTQNMMKFIFEKKPYLLKNNNIDQIILCCVMSCLSINEKQEHQTLEKLFCEYNSKIQFSFNSNQLGLKDQYGNEMKIIEYYNEVFLTEIQDMLAESQEELDDFLLTPVRITKQYFGSNIQQSLQKKKQLPGTFLFNPEKTTNQNTYRQDLVKQNLEMKEEQDEDEQDKEYPIPGLKSIMSFGKLPRK